MIKTEQFPQPNLDLKKKLCPIGFFSFPNVSDGEITLVLHLATKSSDI